MKYRKWDEWESEHEQYIVICNSPVPMYVFSVGIIPDLSFEGRSIREEFLEDFREAVWHFLRQNNYQGADFEIKLVWWYGLTRTQKKCLYDPSSKTRQWFINTALQTKERLEHFYREEAEKTGLLDDDSNGMDSTINIERPNHNGKNFWTTWVYAKGDETEPAYNEEKEVSLNDISNARTATNTEEIKNDVKEMKRLLEQIAPSKQDADSKPVPAEHKQPEGESTAKPKRHKATEEVVKGAMDLLIKRAKDSTSKDWEKGTIKTYLSANGYVLEISKKTKIGKLWAVLYDNKKQDPPCHWFKEDIDKARQDLLKDGINIEDLIDPVFIPSGDYMYQKRKSY